MAVAGALGDRQDYCGVGEDAFGVEESGGQFGILAGSAHGDRNTLFATGGGRTILEVYFQRFFHNHGVFRIQEAVRCYLLDRQAGDAGGSHSPRGGGRG